ncbi:hypothetical protein V5K00_RS23015 [Enterobacter asburiae]
MNNLNPTLKTTTKNHTYTIILDGLKKQNVIEKLQFYGFVECAKMVRFLSLVVESDVIDTPSLKYLLANLNECLERNARSYTDGNSLRYFATLVKLRDEIEYITSIRIE